MRILMPVDPEIPVPPVLYGGVERLVDGLITEYTKLGHEVYLLAHKDSTAKYAKKIFAWKGTRSRNKWHTFQNATTLAKIIQEVKPDIVHHFARLLYIYPSLLLSNVPFVMTYGRKISPYSTGLASFVARNRINFTAAGAHMLNHLKNKQKFTAIHNFTTVDFFVPDNSVDREYLMFLGRIEDIKGTKECIEVALATNNKLIIAGNIQPGHDEYFNTYIKPHLHNPLINYVGPVNDEQKRYYLQRAKAFLFPIKWEEPFGIVMIEAMACGVPVIAFNRGAVPEVVINGYNGFIVNDILEMINCVNKTNIINNDTVRTDCEKRFSQSVIAQQYLKLFDKILQK